VIGAPSTPSSLTITITTALMLSCLNLNYPAEPIDIV